MLLISEELIHALNVKKVRYCMWKSTIRLSQGLTGQTDLDILVDRNHQELFSSILADLRIKRFVSHPSKQYPGFDDYLGFDHASGRMIHLHVHYRLILGEQIVKNHKLELEDVLLDQVRIKTEVRIPLPEIEIIFLVIRALLKY